MKKAVAQVIVKIGDINDNPPRFVDCPSQISFPENAVVGLDGDTRSVRVVDNDIEENGQVWFFKIFKKFSKKLKIFLKNHWQ